MNKRLTEKRFKNLGEGFYSFTKETRKELSNKSVPTYEELYRRLCELEDKLESGQLVELPCIVNTLSPKYKVIVFRGKDGQLYKTHTFEESEAESRLQELRG